MSLESLQKEDNYEQMAKQVSSNATATGRRKPVYINYTPEGKYKEPQEGGTIWQQQKDTGYLATE